MAHASLMKSVAAACLACAFAAQAAPVTVPVGGSFTGMDPAGSGQVTTVSLVGGSGSWELSNGGWKEGMEGIELRGLLELLNLSKSKVKSDGELGPIEQFSMESTYGDLIRTGIQVPTKVAAVGIDHVTQQIESISNVGVVQIQGTLVAGVMLGGTVSISNLRFDLVNQAVVADLTGVRNAVGTRPSATYSLTGATLWTIANVATTPEVIDSTTFASTLTLSGLSLTSEGFDFLKSSLGLLATGHSSLLGIEDHGTIQTRLVFSTAVPEPSTYALLGVGLVGICVGLRRRAGTS